MFAKNYKMRIQKTLALSLLVLTVILSGCKKEELDITSITIVNRLDVPVTLDLYASESDYTGNTNLIERYVIAANDNLKIPENAYEEGKTYFMDWYSEDYYYNNWYNDNFPVVDVRVKITPEYGDNTYYLEPGYRGQARKTFLRGDATETKWIAIGAYLFSNVDGYTNEWNSIGTNERYKQVTVNKDFVADYSYKDETGAIQSKKLEFMVHQTEDAYIEFMTGDGMSGGNMLGGKLPGGTPPDYSSSATDTVMALFPGNDHLYMMIRQ